MTQDLTDRIDNFLGQLSEYRNWWSHDDLIYLGELFESEIIIKELTEREAKFVAGLKKIINTGTDYHPNYTDGVSCLECWREGGKHNDDCPVETAKTTLKELGINHVNNTKKTLKS